MLLAGEAQSQAPTDGGAQVRPSSHVAPASRAPTNQVNGST
jgi:hypothetical protein